MRRLACWLFPVPLLVLGCAGSFEESRASVRIGAPELSARCASLDDQHRTWGGIGKGSAVLAGAAGLSVIPVSGETGKVSLAAGSAVAGAVAATAVYVSEQAAGSYVRECSK